MTLQVWLGASPIKVSPFTFPDGQPHLSVDWLPRNRGKAQVHATLEDSEDVMHLLLLKDVLDHNRIEVDHLLIKYMLGARMDRRMNNHTPATLEVFAKLIRDAGFDHIRVLDPHSIATTALLGAEAVYPYFAFAKVLANRPSLDMTVLVVPDAGAQKRVEILNTARKLPTVQGFKHRDPQTGKLSGFGVYGDVDGKSCLIVDDICDGGGTFTGLAKVLRENGALKVDLFVTHGLFTKGLPLEGIDSVYTTDSVCPDPFPPARVYESS